MKKVLLPCLSLALVFVANGTQGESCTFKITADEKSADVTLYYSNSDD